MRCLLEKIGETSKGLLRPWRQMCANPATFHLVFPNLWQATRSDEIYPDNEKEIALFTEKNAYLVSKICCDL